MQLGAFVLHNYGARVPVCVIDETTFVLCVFEVTLHLSTGISLESKRCFILKVNYDVPDCFISLIQEHGCSIVRYVSH